MLATAVLLLVTGCGTQVDTAKRTHPRTTVPAGDLPAGVTTGGVPGTGEARTNDPAFTPAKLRTLDPCALLDRDLLDEFGKPAKDDHRGGFGECANYMEDDDGRELNITLSLGDTVSDAVEANENIGGLPALEDTLDDEACFIKVVTSTSPNFGIQIQANGDTEDLCGPARRLMASVVDRIRTDPPDYRLAEGTLIEVDPCGLLDADDLAPVIDAAEPTPYNVHWCSWSGDRTSLSARFRLGYDPGAGSGRGTAVDLGGGVTAYQQKTLSSYASCTLEWKHRPFAGDDVEIVTLTFEVGEAKENDDPCMPTQQVAKTLLGALPST